MEMEMMLQWGHNVSVVEILSQCCKKVRRCGCFNGATTFPLWKFDTTLNSFVSDYSFNGATTFPLWKLSNVVVSKWSRNRFNGATTFPLWKSDKNPKATFKRSRLQWGHNVSVVEIITSQKSINSGL